MFFCFVFVFCLFCRGESSRDMPILTFNFCAIATVMEASLCKQHLVKFDPRCTFETIPFSQKLVFSQKDAFLHLF